MSGAPIRVLIVDDSVVTRGLVSRVFESESDIEVVASAANGKIALATLKRSPVDVVVLDIEMPEMDGIEALPRILNEHPGVRVIMASSLTSKGAEVTFKALSLGAADYIQKPSTRVSSRGIQAISDELKRKVRALGGRRQSAPHAAVRPTPAPRPRVASSAPPAVQRQRRPGSPRVLAIGASTGGPNALTAFLEFLTPKFPLPIVVVQHMPPVFTQKLAERFDEIGFESREAEEGDVPRPGTVLVAPGDFHMTLRRVEGKVSIKLDQSPPVHFCRPAVDPLFSSVADCYGADAIAVVLTGMGEDGKVGAGELVQKGSRVLVQDEDTSVVWGMPGAIAKAGLADAILPIRELAAEVTRVVRA